MEYREEQITTCFHPHALAPLVRSCSLTSVIYVIDARTILAPVTPVDVDWDTVHEPLKTGTVARPESELEGDQVNVEARLSVDDIEAVSSNFQPFANFRCAVSPAERMSCLS